MSKIYTINCHSIHCPKCGVLINKESLVCLNCKLNILAAENRYSGNILVSSTPVNNELLLTHCKKCMQTQNFEEAAYYYQLLSSHFKNAKAMYELGKIFLFGLGLPKNLSRAKMCFEAAADLSHIPSKNILARLYCYGEFGFPCNKKLSMVYFKSARYIEEKSISYYNHLLRNFYNDHSEYYFIQSVDYEDDDNEIYYIPVPAGEIIISHLNKYFYRNEKFKYINCYKFNCNSHDRNNVNDHFFRKRIITEFWEDHNYYEPKRHTAEDHARWEIEQDDSMPHDAECEHYYNLYYNDDYDGDDEDY